MKSKTSKPKEFAKDPKDTVVLSLGGSLIAPGGSSGIDTDFVSLLSSLILKNSKHQHFILICGGGKTARDYQNAANKIGKIKGEDLDWIGIQSTRLNAHLLKSIFGSNSHPEIIFDPRTRVQLKKKILVAAGWKPGFSTDYDSVVLAKTHKTRTIINLTNVDYVYTKDPRKFKDAKPIKHISWNEFRNLIGSKWTPGLNAPFDPIASKLAQKLKLRVIIANGKNLGNLEKILEGKDFIGTVIE